MTKHAIFCAAWAIMAAYAIHVGLMGALFFSGAAFACHGAKIVRRGETLTGAMLVLAWMACVFWGFKW